MLDNYDLWKQHEAEKEEWLNKLPVCFECGEHIQDEYCFEINGEYICERCMNENYKKSVDDLVN